MRNRVIPEFVFKLDFMLGSVAFIVIFSVLFMIIYAPFSLTAWFDIFDQRQLSITVAFYISAIAVMVISKISMMWVNSKRHFTLPWYLVWLVGEIIVISLLYSLFTEFLALSAPHSAIAVVLRAFCCVTAILIIPYIISFLYAAYKAKTKENELILLRTQLQNNNMESSRLINLYDHNGTVRMTLDIESLYYMESQDNYVRVYYEDEGTLHSYMLRCRTKTLEKSLSETPIRRCHRSYIINTTKIKMLRPDKSNCFAILKHPNIKAIPVSRRYYDALVETIAVNPPVEHAAESNNNQ